MPLGNPGTWLYGEDLRGDAAPTDPLAGCGCRQTLVWDAKRGYWRHLKDGSPCVAKSTTQAA